jgi:taurine dioxygenase
VERAAASLEFKPLSGALGAEVIGLDLTRPIADPQAAALRSAFGLHHLLLVRGQEVSAEQQAAFARVFGTIAIRERNVIANERADTQHVSNTRKDGVFGEGDLDFHIDQLFQDEPLKALILYGVEIPPEGGDTLFVNAMAAYDALPAALKDRIDTLQCRHAYSYKGALAERWNMQHADADSPTAVHPMAWTDPATKRRAIWVNKLTTVEVLGLPAAEARALTDEVRKPLYDPSIGYRHAWREHDLVVWNNLALQHARTPFDNTHARTLRRTPLM